MNPARGIALKLVSVVIFMAMTSLIKATADDVPPGEAIFFRSFFALPIVIIMLAWTGHLNDGLKIVNRTAHIIRGLVGATAMALMFFGLGHIPLPEAVAIFFAVPIFVTLLAALLLGERIRLYRMGAIALGFVGVLIILSPRLLAAGDTGSDLKTIASVAVFAAAFFAAMAAVFVRKLMATDSAASVSFWFAVFTTLLSLLSAPFGWVLPSWEVVLQLILAGLLGGIAQIFMTTAYRHAEAAVIAPFDYSQIVLALLVGYFVFGELPTQITLIGASLTIAAGLLIIWRERQLGLARKNDTLRS